jgi:hypothetical protein
MGNPAPAVNPAVLNANARAIVTGNAVKFNQQIYSQSINPATNPTINIQPRNVGLITGFIVEVSGTILNTAAALLTRTDMGSSNILKNVAFTDLNNVTRINTTGWHLALLNSARQGFGFGGAYAPNLPMNFGNNYSPFSGPATIAAGANTGVVKHTFWVPVAYSQTDLRGAIYAAIVNATMNLQLTLNATPCAGVVGVGNADPLGFVYGGNAAANWQGNVQVNVNQVYLDQIPQGPNGPILPVQDLNTIYDLKYTTQNGLAVGQDFPVSYANFRQFLSTTLVFDNGGAYNAGTDLNYLSLTAANSTNLFKLTPSVAALQARQTFMADPPPGVYYFDHRDRPIDTMTFGNMQIVANPITVNAGAQLVVGYESFQQTNQLPAASSLSGAQ